jgi:hypothetical protein
MANGSVTLGEVSMRMRRIKIACSRCDRRGQYRVSRLMASLGADFPMTDLAAHIVNCRRKTAALWERCDFYYPGLGAVMNGDGPGIPDAPDSTATRRDDDA